MLLPRIARRLSRDGYGMLGRVSPKSRGRKVKAGRRGRRVRGNAAQASAGAATRPGAARRSPSSARSEFADALAGQLKVLGDPESVPSAFRAEVATSVVLGNVTEAGTKEGIKPETTRELLVEAIRHMVEGLERGTPPYAYPVLRALAVLAPPEVAEHAAGAAAELAGIAARCRARTTALHPPQGERLRGSTTWHTSRPGHVTSPRTSSARRSRCCASSATGEGRCRTASSG